MLDQLDIKAAVERAKVRAKKSYVEVPELSFTQLETGVWVVRQTNSRVRRSEADEQTDLFHWLRTEGVARGYVAHSVPNDAQSDPKRIGNLKRTGMTPGAPDLYVFTGRPIAIEMKRANGKLSDLEPHQEGFLSTLARLPNWIACVCFGCPAALGAIERWATDIT